MGWRAVGLTLWADLLRRHGRYGHQLRRLRWLAWRDRPDGLRGQRLAQCWRDHGRPLPGRWCRALEAVAAAGTSPRLAPLLESAHGPEVAAMRETRAAFAAWLHARVALGPVCVVGNAGSLLSRAEGPQIDAHAVVLRFNRWRQPDQDAARALGHRLDVWVAAPDCRDVPEQDIAWAVISGADPWVAMEAWPSVQALRARGVPVVTVPLGIWKALVDRLGAPPSAGLLVLAWLLSLGLGEGRLRMTGVAEPAEEEGGSHVLGAWHRRGRRHAWERERALVAEWCASGALLPLHRLQGGPV